jgi:hypothetical protein
VPACHNTHSCRDQNNIEKPALDYLRSKNLSRIGSCLYLLILASVGSYAGVVYSADVRPLYSFNQNPLIHIYGLPAMGEARVLAQDASDVALRLQISNNFTGAQSVSEYLILDGETHRLTMAWRQGLADGREWGFELPYLWTSGGFLDSYIERFHDSSNLPQGGRTSVPRNQVNYRYARHGVNLINVANPVNGPGDLRLLGAKQIETSETSGYTTALRASLKLPTGKESELLGSGSTDLALWLSAATTRPLDQWNIYGGGGLLFMTEGNVLPLQQRNQVAFGTLGISRMFFPHLIFIGQLDAQTPFYDYTNFRQLNSYPVQGLVGARWELMPRKFLEFSISEDLVVDTSADVVFSLSLILPF